MTHLPPVPPLTSLTPAAMLMAVLDVIESPAFVEETESRGGVNRPDGVRMPGWNLRFQANHLVPKTGTWMDELDHAVTHAMAAGNAQDLQAALRVIAAVSASWALALEVRSQGDGS